MYRTSEDVHLNDFSDFTDYYRFKWAGNTNKNNFEDNFSLVVLHAEDGEIEGFFHLQEIASSKGY